MSNFPDFGKYLTFAQAIKSDYAIRHGIDNTPTAALYTNMVITYQQIIVPVFDHFGRLPITSFYRTPKLNAGINGSKTSGHMQGQCVDIDCDGEPSVTNRQLFDWIRKNLDFDQLILEAPDKHNNPSWVHCGYRSKATNRHQVLRMVWQNGKQVYTVI